MFALICDLPHTFAGISEGPLKQPFVRLRKGVRRLRIRSVRERGFRVQIVADVPAPSLDKMGGKPPAMGFILLPGELGGQVLKVRREEP